jgi:hypothetical protein
MMASIPNKYFAIWDPTDKRRIASELGQLARNLGRGFSYPAAPAGRGWAQPLGQNGLVVSATDRASTTLACISNRIVVVQPLAHRAHRTRISGADNSHSTRSHSGFRATFLRYKGSNYFARYL